MTVEQDVAATELREDLFLSEEFPTREALEREVEFWDATQSQWIGDCPRRAEYAIRMGLVPAEEALFLKAGRALHAGLDVLYTGMPELALQEIARGWGHEPAWKPPRSSDYGHLSLGHLEAVFKYYMDFARRRDAFKPLVFRRQDLNMTDVVAAIWKVNDLDQIVLGECKLVMRFTVFGKPFIIAGRPDLPIHMGGAYYTLDHKSSNSFLSGWWAAQFRFSNQFRIYCAMLQKLTGITFSGALVNGIYMGNRAADPRFEGQRVARFGPFLFTPGHLEEATHNLYAWRRALDFWEDFKYYPQHTSKLCGGCPYNVLCAASPALRGREIQQQFVTSSRGFLDL